ncbi:hypothetical protein [Paenibacillus alvei]|uniref:hypothetical protein n=1 Tax=Paenibacillus TaxID=44249 RepID=UPI0022805CCD|nr:hypothetical protein [Paenibacillus alvei]
MSEALMMSNPLLQHKMSQGSHLLSDQTDIGTAYCPSAAVMLDHEYDDVFMRKA